MNVLPWFRKYTPSKVSEIIGQDNAIKTLKAYVKNYQPGQKALLLFGPSGVGKTALVCALARENNLELIEVNASDVRNKEGLNSIVGSASQQMSLFNRPKLILIDEMDGLAGNADRGGVPEIARLIQSSAFPIVLTANDPYDYRFNIITYKCNLAQMKPLSMETVLEILKPICIKEEVEFDEDALRMLARSCGGDVRGALNDLQSLAGEKISKDSVLSLGERERSESMIQALVKIFKTLDPKTAREALEGVEEDVNKVFLWMDENIAKEYMKPRDLQRAYDAVSVADMFFGRIRRWQHYRYYVYCYDLLSAGVALAKDEKYREVTMYKPTMRLLKIWQANQRNAKRKAIVSKLAKHTHASSKRILRSSLPYFISACKQNKAFAKQVGEQLGLEKEEVAWLSDEPKKK
ncbi:MAG TPA: replication factor C large subunit [Candidatus Nanoarchaeia archaeon]|nr:replication factor C large subunit [Candidatus Nanoarchaeia archaeon]